MEATIEKPTITYPTGLTRAILIITAISCAIIEMIDMTVVNVSLREISGNIGATTTEIAWVITAYSIANVIIIPLTSMLSNLFGRKAYFTGSVVVFTIASLMCGFSGSLWTLVFWRFIQGLGGGGLVSTAQSIVFGAFPPEKRKTAMLFYAMGVTLGPAFGPILGGYITDNYSWHWIFFINIPIGIIASILSWKYIPDLEGVTKPKIDWLGIFFLIIGVGSLQYVLEEGVTKDWFESSEIIFFTITAISGIIAFVIRELSIDYPAVDLRLYKNFNLLLGNILNMVLGMIMIGTIFIFPLFVQNSLGWSATQTGAFMIPSSLFIIVAMMFTKKILEKGANPKQLILTGIGLNMLYLVMLSFSSPDSNSSNFYLPFMLRTLGIVFIMLPVMELSVSGLVGKDLAQASGFGNMFKQLGGAFGVAFMSIYINNANASVRSNMISNISEFNPINTEKFNTFKQLFLGNGYSPDEASNAAYQMLNNSLTKQVNIVSYDHGFMFVALALITTIPIVLLIKNKKKIKKTTVSLDAH
ncbi:DHA2 family efflux MFS transporter permease subunit [Flavobacterium psychrophilum]|uniref:DHA2 family efflux MFS transporter permease subunit n=1 Tax=Flavobacterium psychrophilum TaxID=96345 RepID=UPI000B7C3BBA|nr:DHA2 family efflux MFS transporter permease subunit [Flavobacterium psychrophilum]EKT4500633.1 DHA2 family efflux MFS transporter permease subunit [Flavobacterium psychrophilum]MBF2023694.1 DHA2 family efflux MFS transporter permease subunit [Flavobacterium psychrophilum]MCB5984301.1 DHA2 family efflux MFS transporter permease subunit [Flavobacterium psychrophilum]MCB5994324.1 DHA2 family efflux MFS transporter permease subunit [Flavobacterium psychrophilum]MCB5996469.1 DHA2 family efflux M